ncbi:DUF4179 domain-containing protein [Proteiniborus sp. MB09-C3]|uniref:DUF4179 domain-containing protein n=1 Tax=Proteiniborus sp. MB09-C3 TaxID=3050072 RepID=UPI0025553809|nr:DUF4179 domain-containing protein [Proteiniborus sp. MB09-C3]WIV12920.1 DUF4179 domain-containing protein [Proteiniborus sp. MB09-C3]
MNKDDINKLFQKLEPGDNKRIEIYNKIMDKKNNAMENNMREIKNDVIIRAVESKIKGKIFRPIIVLSLVFVLSIIGFAVSNKYQDFSNRVIDWSVSEDATQINISDADKGYKITAESLFGDSKVVYIVFSIEREDGKEIRIRERDGRTSFGVKTSREYIGASEDEDISDAKSYYALNRIDEKLEKVYFLKRYSTDFHDIVGGTLIGENLHLEISGLNLGLFGRTVNGNWVLDVPLEYKDLGQIHEINKEFEYEDGIAKLEKIYYSPLDIRIYLTSENGDLKGMSLKDFNEEHYVDIKLKDGNYIPRTGGSAEGDNLGTYYNKNMYTIEYGEIELENIRYIIIGDLEILIDFNDI